MIITGKKFSKPAMSRVINGDTVLDSAPERPVFRRLDHILVEQHPEFNRSTLQNFIKSGYVTVDGAVVRKPNAEIRWPEETTPDDELTAEQNTTAPRSITDATVSEPAARPEIILSVPPRITPPDLSDRVIYEDNNVLVLNKPAGMLSIAKGEYTAEPTLEDYGLLVHRLDRDTSGVVILAKNPATQSMLRRQFQERQTHKTYYAAVLGRPKLSEAQIDLPIARNIKHPTTFLVDPGGKPSQTYYRVKADNSATPDAPLLSLLELRPVTGRTHQLRVHLRYLGHPILGDKVYGDTANDQIVYKFYSKMPQNRLFLHAFALEITIPGENSNIRRKFTAPLPPEFNDVF